MIHAVALVPGFLGFDHQGELTYFADRFLAGLRSAIESAARQSVRVMPIRVPPIGSLAERQEALIGALTNLDARSGGPFSWHLVGHSTGGLDVALLARTTKLAYDADKGSIFSTEKLAIERLASITTLSTPHYGTCLARAPLPAATRAGKISLEDRIKGLSELPALALEVTQRDALLARLSFGRGASARNTVDFFWHLLFNNRLARDLDPHVAARLTARTDNRRDDVPVCSIATMAPRPVPGETQDKLFAHLWTWTQLRAEGAEPAAPPLELRADVERIASDPSKLPGLGEELGAIANDGVVNTNRQVFGTFAALVLADHGDVLGRYRRMDPFDGSILDPGLLTSGATFEDDQFFALLRLVARGIADAIGAGGA
jgi:pimeloyl-ACP methyl ester carboxylesterase